MNNKEIKDKLKKRADEIIVPNILDDIKTADFSAHRTDDSSIVPQKQIIVQKRPILSRKRIVLTTMATVMAAFILIFAFVIVPQSTFDKTVYATVDMSAEANFSIDLNKKMQVVDITSNCDEGKEILKNMSYKERNFNDILTEILKACVDMGCITEAQIDGDEIMFFINCKNQRMKNELQGYISGCMNSAKEHCLGRQ